MKDGKMATAYLIVGNVGAGKSTYANTLSTEMDAEIFANDEWMSTLFMMDMPDPPEYNWALERTRRIEAQILDVSLKFLGRDINVILDLGFFAKEQRQRVTDFYSSHGIHATTCYLDVDKDTRWQRVNVRNTLKTETFQFPVSKETFDFCETIFEPMDEEEINGALLVPSF